MTSDDSPRDTVLPPSAPRLRQHVDDAELSRIAERNLRAAMSLRATAWELMAAGLRTFRPELSEEDVQDEVRFRFRRAAG